MNVTDVSIFGLLKPLMYCNRLLMSIVRLQQNRSVANERTIPEYKNACARTEIALSLGDKIMDRLTPAEMTHEDWFNLGKADAWAKKAKIAPEHDSQAASLYDLGYNEGEIEHSPTDISPLSTSHY